MQLLCTQPFSVTAFFTVSQIDLKFPNDSAIHEVPKVKESKYAYAVNLVDNHRHEALDEILRLLQQYA